MQTRNKKGETRVSKSIPWATHHKVGSGFVFVSVLVLVMMRRLGVMNFRDTQRLRRNIRTNEANVGARKRYIWAQKVGFVMICLQRDQGNHVELDGNPKEIQAN